MEYFFSKTVNLSYDQAMSKVTDELKKEGFGILTEIDVNTGKVDLGVLQGRAHSEVSKMQLFMDVLKSLEGDNKMAVEEKLFVTELVKSSKFTEEEARNYIRRMLREASIYESRPGHYNRV